MKIVHFHYLMLMIVTTLNICLVSCSGDNDDAPDPNKQDEAATIVGKWTYEDYRTGDYRTFEFKNNGEYTILYAYDEENKDLGRYKYDSKTQSLDFEHFYQEIDFEEHGDDPDWITYLNVKCIIIENSLIMIGEDCEEFDLPSPVELKKGPYSGDCPDFKSLLCDMGQYRDEDNRYYNYDNSKINEKTEFHFYPSGKVEFMYSLEEIKNNEVFNVMVNASGTFSIDNYLLNCRFTKVSKEQTDRHPSDHILDQFTDGIPTDFTFYLALDEYDYVIISDYPIYY